MVPLLRARLVRSASCAGVAALATTGLLAVAACSARETTAADGPTASTAPTSSTSASPATAPATTAAPSTTPGTAAPSPADDEAAVLAAYQGFWDTWLQANDPPNPDHPGLARYYAGPALEKARAEITKNRQSGLLLRRPASSSFGFQTPSIEINGASAILTTCLVDDGLVVLQSSGAIVDSTVVNSDIEAHLTRSTDGWKVSENRFLEKRSGSSCP